MSSRESSPDLRPSRPRHAHPRTAHQPQARSRSKSLSRQIQKLSLQDPQTPQSKPNTRSHANPSVPGAPNPSRFRHLFRPEPNSLTRKVLAHDILLEHLYHCKVIKGHSPKVNARAKLEGFDKIPFSMKPPISWECSDGQTLEALFKTAVIDYDNQSDFGEISSWGEFKAKGQFEGDLLTESDVDNAVLINVLNPLIDICTGFIKPELHTHFHCFIRAQQTVPAKEGSSSAPGRLDFMIAIAERDPKLDYLQLIPLVMVESKAPGIVREQDWEPDPSGAHNKDRMKILMPQVLLYSHYMKCCRFFMTSYTHSYCVRIDKKTLAESVRELEQDGDPRTRVKLQVIPATQESTQDADFKAPQDFGFRVALAYEVYLALFEIGAANPHLVDKKMNRTDVKAIDPRFTHFMETQLFHGVRRNSSPTPGGENLHYSIAIPHE